MDVELHFPVFVIEVTVVQNSYVANAQSFSTPRHELASIYNTVPSIIKVLEQKTSFYKSHNMIFVESRFHVASLLVDWLAWIEPNLTDFLFNTLGIEKEHVGQKQWKQLVSTTN